MKTLNSAEFEENVLKNSGRVLVDFYATWCGPCKMLSPVLEGLAPEYEGKVDFVKVDTDQAVDVALGYKVSAIPTVILFENGEEVNRFVGFRPEEEIKDFLAEA